MRLPSALALAALVSPSAAQASVTTFDPSAFFTASLPPTPAETAALDVAVGIVDFLVEDFEDSVFLPGLSVLPSLGVGAGACGSVSLLADPDATWDLDKTLASNLLVGGAESIVFEYPAGTSVFCVGLSGFQLHDRLLVNDVDLGSVLDLPNFLPSVGQNSRNVYVRIDRDPGAPPITRVEFAPDPAQPNPAGDCVRVDHVAISPCADQASAAIVRLGVPPNSAAFSAAVGPILGTNWAPVIDHSTFVTSAVADFVLVSNGSLNVSIGFPGVLLCNPSAPLFSLLGAPAPGAPFSIPIPASCTLVGVDLYSQGGSIDGGGAPHLTNALDLTIGTF